MKIKNKKAIAALAALAAVTVVGGTWAYWSQDLKAVNEFETGKYDSDIVEEFTPPLPGEWIPGVSVEKQVMVKNSGNVKLAAAASINQVWVRTEDVVNDDDPNNEVVIPPAAGEYFDLMFEDKNGDAVYASIINWGDADGKGVVALASLKDEADGLGIKETVSGLDAAEAKDKWVLVAATNNKDTNKDGKGYSDVKFIFNGILGENGVSPNLLTSVKLNELINTTITSKTITNYVDADGNAVKKTETKTNPVYGYDSAKYTMTVNATTVQAMGSAIKEAFVSGKGFEAALIDTFLDVHKDELIADSIDAKTE